MFTLPQIQIEQFPGAPDAFPIVRMTAGASGFDICAAADAVIEPGAVAVISTGIRLRMPHGIEAQIRSRSGLAAKYGVCVLNAPGTVDSDYDGELKVILHNTQPGPAFKVARGDRIAQVVFACVEPVWVTGLANDNALAVRGEGGLGSTGI